MIKYIATDNFLVKTLPCLKFPKKTFPFLFYSYMRFIFAFSTVKTFFYLFLWMSLAILYNFVVISHTHNYYLWWWNLTSNAVRSLLPFKRHKAYLSSAAVSLKTTHHLSSLFFFIVRIFFLFHFVWLITCEKIT